MTFNNNINADDYKNDIKLDNSCTPLSDSISAIAWSNSLPNVFATTAWDGSLKIYEIQGSQMGPAIQQRLNQKFNSPALKLCWNGDSSQVYVGLADGSIKSMDINSNNMMDIGKHSGAISSLHLMAQQNTIISSAYDSNVMFWQGGNPNPVFNINAENKIFTSDFQSPILVAGLGNEKILIVDMNMMNTKTIIDSSDLGKFSQIQSIAINSKCSTFGIASIDGRANISSLSKGLNNLYTQKSVITFKSNKQEEAGNTILYPINSVSFSNVSEKWFMTAGSDGNMHFWDFEAKNKIRSLNYAGIPICAAKVSPKGDMIAYALGNDWHIGQEGSKWQPKIGVHMITEQETKFAK